MWTDFHNYFTVKFRKDLWRKLGLKLLPPLNYVATLPCEKYMVSYTALHYRYFSSEWRTNV